MGQKRRRGETVPGGHRGGRNTHGKTVVGTLSVLTGPSKNLAVVNVRCARPAAPF